MSIPRELHLTICSHFDEDFLNIYIKSHNLTFEKKDYIFLFSNRYPNFYSNNLYKYNVERLYKDFLFVNTSLQKLESERLFRIPEEIINLYKLYENIEYIICKNWNINNCTYSADFAGYCHNCIFNNNDVKQELSKIGLTNEMIKILYQKSFVKQNFIKPYSIKNLSNISIIIENKDKKLYYLYRYLFLEGYIKLENIVLDFIYKNDDLEIFLKIYLYYINDLSLVQLLWYKSIKILKYLFTNTSLLYIHALLLDFLDSLILSIKYTTNEYYIDLECFKIIFKNKFFKNENVFNDLIFTNLNKEITKYIINEKYKHNENLIYYLLMDKLNDDNITTFFIPNILLDIIIPHINNNELDELIESLCNTEKISNKYNLIKKISNKYNLIKKIKID